MTKLPINIPCTLDKVLAKHFDTNSSKVVFEPNRSNLLTLAFGSDITDTELINFCGAPTGSTLTIHYEPATIRGEVVPEGLYVDIVNTQYFAHPMTVVFYEEAGGRTGVYIKLVVAQKIPSLPAVGGLVLETMIRAWDTTVLAKRAPRNFNMLAAGGRTWRGIGNTSKRWDGFAVWARYGFDMPLQAKTKDMFQYFPHVPPLAGAVNHCTSVSALLSLPGGLEFWDLVGDGSYMKFDLDRASHSRDTLSKYLLGKYP